MKISIFLPVRNGGGYLPLCVKSVLAQTYPEFVLHVLDNQSTDGSVSRLEEIGDPRIVVSRSSRPLSIEESWARIRHESKEEFMTTVGHDDLFEPDFLETIRRLARRHPEASLYQTGARLINVGGGTIRRCRPAPERETAAQYLGARFRYERDIGGTGYVMRSADYDRLGGIPPFAKLLFADDALWLGLMRRSYKAADDRVGVAVRIHPGSESASAPAAWPFILTGLEQFYEFLSTFVEGEPAVRSVWEREGPGFFLRYYRNVLIYALVDACQRGRRLDPATRRRIENSLASRWPALAAGLGDSPRLALLRAWNLTPARIAVRWAWKAYYSIRTRSR